MNFDQFYLLNLYSELMVIGHTYIPAASIIKDTRVIGRQDNDRFIIIIIPEDILYNTQQILHLNHWRK
ncbi:hypothetical protein DERF_002462 [Dermatophagoides farinae]|uniref:Uncharacterized protein n=1 Tax=Dermatophagoides farinae TaxID=6954 RepID=A0A922L9N8_DERFA|nr:hypothetical protein DERF_002462 [Dermatophagoides farinae]